MFAWWASLIPASVIFLCLSCILAGDYANECPLTLIPPMYLLLFTNKLTSDECNHPQLSSCLTFPMRHSELLSRIAHCKWFLLLCLPASTLCSLSLPPQSLLLVVLESRALQVLVTILPLKFIPSLCMESFKPCLFAFESYSLPVLPSVRCS